MKTGMTVRIGSKEKGYRLVETSSFTPQFPTHRLQELSKKILRFLFDFLSHKKIIHAFVFTAFMYVFLDTLGFGLLTPLYIGCEEMIKEMIIRSF